MKPSKSSGLESRKIGYKKLPVISAYKKLDEWFVDAFKAIKIPADKEENSSTDSEDFVPKAEEFAPFWIQIFQLFDANIGSEGPLAEDIAHLMSFLNYESALLYFKQALKMMSKRWLVFSSLRAARYMVLIRKMLRQALILLKIQMNPDTPKAADQFSGFVWDVLASSELQVCGPPLLHFVDIYLEEVAEVFQKKDITTLLGRFVDKIADASGSDNEEKLIDEIVVHIFQYLLQQYDLNADLTLLPDWNPSKRVTVVLTDPDTGISKIYRDQTGMLREIVLPPITFDAAALQIMFQKHERAPNVLPRYRKILKTLASQCRVFNSLLTDPQSDGDEQQKIDQPDAVLAFERNSGVWLVTLTENPSLSTKFNIPKAETAEIDVCRCRSKRKPGLSPSRTENGVIKKLNDLSPRNLGQLRRKQIADAHTISDLTESDEELHSPPAKKSRTECTVNGVTNGIFPKLDWDNSTGDEPESSPPVKLKIEKEENDTTPTRPSTGTTPNLGTMLDFWRQKKNGQSSLSADLMKDPFSKDQRRMSTPAKRVKINLKMNRSQEVVEWNAQMRRSPGNPHDAEKKPQKSALKSPLFSSPIHPKLYAKVFGNKQKCGVVS